MKGSLGPTRRPKEFTERKRLRTLDKKKWGVVEDSLGGGKSYKTVMHCIMTLQSTTAGPLVIIELKIPIT